MHARKSANMMDRVHVDELLSVMNTFLFTTLSTVSFFLPLYLYSRIEFFFLPLHLDLCLPHYDCKLGISREKRFFFSEIFTLRGRRLSYRLCTYSVNFCKITKISSIFFFPSSIADTRNPTRV